MNYRNVTKIKKAIVFFEKFRYNIRDCIRETLLSDGQRSMQNEKNE